MCAARRETLVKKKSVLQSGWQGHSNPSHNGAGKTLLMQTLQAGYTDCQAGDGPRYRSKNGVSTRLC